MTATMSGGNAALFGTLAVRFSGNAVLGLPVVILGGLAAGVLTVILYKRLKRSVQKRRRAKIKASFGQIPPEPRYMDGVRIYYEQTRQVLPGEPIDDVTWNDLEMDRVFARINHTSSYIGEQVLYRRLRTGDGISDGERTDDSAGSEAAAKREAAAEFCSGREKVSYEEWEHRLHLLDEREEERTDLEMALAGIGKAREDYHLPVFLFHAGQLEVGPIWLYRVLQCLLAAAVIAGILLRQKWCLLTVGVVALVNLCVYSVEKVRCEAYLSALGSIREMAIFGRFLVNKEAYGEFIPGKRMEEAVHSLKSVTRVIGHFQFRKRGAMTGDVLELLRDYLVGVTLWDFTMFHWLMKQLERKQKDVLVLYEGIGELDMAIAVCSFRRNLPCFCAPEICAGKRMAMEQMYHPLLSHPVGNDWYIEKNCILTGSNASGKSTCIKALAVNAILARGIHTCAAERFSLPPMYVITSMTLRDDIAAGESYYIREVRYLKRLVDRGSHPGCTLCIIDEILKGTNTKERLAASEAVLSFLENTSCLVIAATHDRELATVMADRYENYHFRNDMEGGEIHFDYRLHPGISDSSNAVALLEIMGFPKEIVAEAGRLCG